ncbi:MAG: glycosyltransferase family 2 protein [Candidatus Omnitrophota bacterium]|jgi:glycosyltransferase involved in cell wall biosynthesis|nr:MAG: glycosyltransferase family 2 protein [Candidatus Omnitrophota bacterium]
MHNRLSVVVLTKNEERYVRNALESTKWADEIIIIDDMSTDATLEICREYTDKIFTKQLINFSDQREYGISRASGEWVLFLDADDQLSPPLQEEIRQTLAADSEYSGFMLLRISSYLGKWIAHCGWRAPILLLFRKDKARIDGRLIHEKILIDGKVGVLKNIVYHHAYDDLSEHIIKLDFYTRLEAEELWKKGTRLKGLDYALYLFAKPVFAFLRKYFGYKGYREGVRGFLISVMTAFVVLLSYAKLWEKQKNEGMH